MKYIFLCFVVLVPTLAFADSDVIIQLNKDQKIKIVTEGCDTDEYPVAELTGGKVSVPTSKRFRPKQRIVDWTNAQVKVTCAPKKCVYYAREFTLTGWQWAIDLYPEVVRLESGLHKSNLPRKLSELKSRNICKEFEQATDYFGS